MTNQKPIYVVSNPAVDEALREGASWSLRKILSREGIEAKDIHQSVHIDLPLHRKLVLPFLVEYGLTDVDIDKILSVGSVKDRGTASILDVKKIFNFDPNNYDVSQSIEVYKNLGRYTSLKEGVRSYMEATNGQANSGQNIVVAPFGRGKFVWDYLSTRFGKQYNIMPFHEDEARRIAHRRAVKADDGFDDILDEISGGKQ